YRARYGALMTTTRRQGMGRDGAQRAGHFWLPRFISWAISANTSASERPSCVVSPFLICLPNHQKMAQYNKNGSHETIRLTHQGALSAIGIGLRSWIRATQPQLDRNAIEPQPAAKVSIQS